MRGAGQDARTPSIYGQEIQADGICLALSQELMHACPMACETQYPRPAFQQKETKEKHRESQYLRLGPCRSCILGDVIHHLYFRADASD